MAIHHRRHETRPPGSRVNARVARALPVLVLLGAAAWFSLGITLTLEWIDEGQIVYPSWLVALGARPYRDFQQLYGPSVFLFNGALFQIFGEDLLVIRASLVLIKACTALLVFLCARRVATTLPALLASGFLILVWGAPWWAFNTPYSNHYAMTATLAGLLAWLALPARPGLGAFAAGLCFGLAASFKQTSGLFAFVAFALFSLHDTLPRLSSARSEPASRDAGARTLRMATLLGCVGILWVYVWPRNQAYDLVALLSSTLAISAVLALREIRAGFAPGAARAGVERIVWCGVGLALPLAIYAVDYAARGLLGELVFNTVAGLPQEVAWRVPLPRLQPRALLWMAALAASLASVFAWSARRPWRIPISALAALGVAMGGWVFAADLVAAEPNPSHASGSRWYRDFAQLWFAFPFAVTWAGFAWVLLPASRARSTAPPHDERPAALFAFLAIASLFLLYPAGDLWHVLMALPAFLPLLAHLMSRYLGRFPSPAPLAARAALVVVVLLLSIPCVHALAAMRLGTRADAYFQRASGISDPNPQTADMGRLVDYLATHTPPDRRLLITTGEHQLYFLAGRRSALEKQEYVLYLRGAGIVSPSDARELLSQADAIRTLEHYRPLIVERAVEEAPSRFRVDFERAFPEIARYLRTHYAPAEQIGDYRILERIDATTGNRTP